MTETPTPKEVRSTPVAQDASSEDSVRKEAQRLETDSWSALMNNSDFKSQYDEAEKLYPHAKISQIRVRIGNSVVNVDKWNAGIAEKYKGAGIHVSVGSFTEEELERKRSRDGSSLSDLPIVSPFDAVEDIFIDSGKTSSPNGPDRLATYQYFGPDVAMPPKGGIVHAAEDRQHNTPDAQRGIEGFIQRFKSGHLEAPNVPAPTPHTAPAK